MKQSDFKSSVYTSFWLTFILNSFFWFLAGVMEVVMDVSQRP